MKKEFKNHIKYGSCWYDKFFKILQKTIIHKPSQNFNAVTNSKTNENKK
jgi:hypothetical protein